MSEPGAAFAWPDVLGALLRGEDLSSQDTGGAMRAIMSGEATSAQIAGFLVGLRAKGETVAEITGLVRTMRELALTVSVPVEGQVVDTCGTGGDRAGTFNVSTLAALVVAGAGAPVAKHGNRAASGSCGSADLLEAWGVVIDLPPEGVTACIEQAGIGFCFAPRFHPATRHAVPVRKELGVPTVFNYLGPLTNPAGARHQTVGVSDPTMAPRMAQVLAELGSEHAMVFHGEDGLDELTTTGPSHMYTVRGGEVSESSFDPGALGLAPATLADLQGGDVEDNMRIGDAVLSGEQGPRRDIVVLGAAAALIAADVETRWSDALARAGAAIDSGAAAGALQRLIEVSRAQR